MTMPGVPRQEDARLPETACEYALHLPVVHADDLRIDVGQPQQFLQPRHDRFRIKLLGIVRLEGEVEQPFLAMPIVMVGPERDHHATPPGATLLRVDEPADHGAVIVDHMARSEEHTSELQSLIRLTYTVFC